MNETGLNEEEIISLLNNARTKDFSYDRVLSSMCTNPHRVAIMAHMQFIESNMGDFGLFKGTHAMEKEVIRMTGSMLHCALAQGYLTTGGTESNIQAVRSMRNLHVRKHPDSRLNVVVPKSAHFSFDKVSDILDIEVRKAALDSDLRVSVDAMRSLIDENTVGLVAIAGSTEFGQVDPISSISELALEYRLPLHIDAAFGGFVLPFLEEEHAFDFSLPGVTSIAIDPHKMGLSTLPSGILLFREFRHLSCLKAHTPYLTVDSQYTLTGTRSGAAVAATFAVMKFLGKEGYTRTVSNCMKMTRYLIRKAAEAGVQPVIDPLMNVVALKVPDPAVIRSILSREYDWHVSITQEPKALRLVIMPHMSYEMIDMFMADLAKVLGSGIISERSKQKE